MTLIPICVSVLAAALKAIEESLPTTAAATAAATATATATEEAYSMQAAAAAASSKGQRRAGQGQGRAKAKTAATAKKAARPLAGPAARGSRGIAFSTITHTPPRPVGF